MTRYAKLQAPTVKTNQAAPIRRCRVGKNQVAPADSEIGGAPMTDDRRVLSIAAFCHRYDIGRTMAYAEMAAGRLRFCKVGRSRRVRVDDAESWSISTRQPQPPCGPDSSNRGAE
jgi:hypothetical protein